MNEPTDSAVPKPSFGLVKVICTVKRQKLVTSDDLNHFNHQVNLSLKNGWLYAPHSLVGVKRTTPMGLDAYMVVLEREDEVTHD